MKRNILFLQGALGVIYFMYPLTISAIESYTSQLKCYINKLESQLLLSDFFTFNVSQTLIVCQWVGVVCQRVEVACQWESLKLLSD